MTPVYAVVYDFGAAELDSVYESKERAHERREQLGNGWKVLQAPFHEGEVKDSAEVSDVMTEAGLHDLAVDLIDIVEMDRDYSVKIEFVKREIRARLWTKEVDR